MSVDINCDMGEGFGAYRIGEDEKIIPRSLPPISPAAFMRATRWSWNGPCDWPRSTASR